MCHLLQAAFSDPPFFLPHFPPSPHISCLCFLVCFLGGFFSWFSSASSQTMSCPSQSPTQRTDSVNTELWLDWVSWALPPPSPGSSEACVQGPWRDGETHKRPRILVEHEVPADGVLKGFHGEVWRREVGEALSQVHSIILTGQFGELHPGQQMESRHQPLPPPRPGLPPVSKAGWAVHGARSRETGQLASTLEMSVRLIAGNMLFH